MSDLIDVDRKSWKMDLLKQVFMPFEVENIGGIPLSIRLPEDKQIWAEASNGYFSVRSAYKIALELDKHDDRGSIFDESHMRSFWKKLWKVRVPHKVKHFAWRAAKDILPTKANLVQRHVLGDGTCEE